MANGSINAKPGLADIFVLFKAWESYFYYYVCAVLFKEKQKKKKGKKINAIELHFSIRFKTINNALLLLLLFLFRRK